MKLAKTLGLRDIVLFNVTAIIGLRWISLAAANGNTSLLLWIAAMLFFFLPQAFAVIDLTRRMPGEGGVYLWTKTAFGDFHGFMSGWCYWTNNLVYFPNLLVYIAGISVFVAGGQYQAVGAEKMYVLAFSLAVMWGVMLLNVIGLQFGKWINNAGGIGTWLAGLTLVLLGIMAYSKFGNANPLQADSFTEGILTLDKLSFWASMCFGFAGLELASVLADEVKDATRTIPRAIVVSGIVIAVIYVLGTLTLLVVLPSNEINIISGILQGIAAVAEKLGFGWASQIVALFVTLGGIGGVMAWFTGAARMPFVAGVDHYLPETFGKIHPKYGTPYIAAVVQGIIASLFILMSFVGATVEEAYLILLDTTLLVYFVPYVYMFAAYIVLRYKAGETKEVVVLKLPIYGYILGACGFITTIAAMVFAMLPPSETSNVFVYELKVVGGFLLFILSGAIIYRVETKKLSHR